MPGVICRFIHHCLFGSKYRKATVSVGYRVKLHERPDYDVYVKHMKERKKKNKEIEEEMTKEFERLEAESIKEESKKKAKKFTEELKNKKNIDWESSK